MVDLISGQMAEPTCDEINRELSREFDGYTETLWSAISPCRLNPYCGPSADPVLGLMKRQHIVWDAFCTTTATVNVYAAGNRGEAQATDFPEASARAVYAMLRAKEKTA